METTTTKKVLLFEMEVFSKQNEKLLKSSAKYQKVNYVRRRSNFKFI